MAASPRKTKATRKKAAAAAGGARGKKKATGKAAAKKKAAGKAPPCVKLGSTVGIREVAALHGQLKDLLDAPEVIIDAGAVDRVDTAVLQVLTAFVRDRREAGHAVQWQAPSEALRRAATLVDLAGVLGVDPLRGEAP